VLNGFRSTRSHCCSRARDRVDEWSLIEKKIPSFDVVYSIDRQRLTMNRDTLSPEQEALLPLLDGHRDINGLIRDSGLGEFDVGKALYGLLNASFLLPIGRKRTTPTLPRNASPGGAARACQRFIQSGNARRSAARVPRAGRGSGGPGRVFSSWIDRASPKGMGKCSERVHDIGAERAKQDGFVAQSRPRV